MDIKDTVLLNAAGNLYWKDRGGLYLGCNLTYARVARLKDPKDIVGKSDYDLYSDLLSEAELDKIHEADLYVITHGTEMSYEELGVDEKGNKAYYLSKKIPIKDKHGDIVGITGNSIDITELKLAKDTAEAANQLKTEFIQNMQHDIRTPISGIWSLLNNMMHSDNLQKFRDTIPYAEKASKELLDICNEVIDFEHVQYGDKPLFSHKFSLIDLAHSVINLNSAAAIVHSTSLSLDIAPDVPDIIKGDDYRLKKILINLVGNAVKFTEQGRVTLKVQCLKHAERKASLRFAVTDTGIGIPPDQIEKIFEKFTRLNPSNAGKFKGSGLGLYIVKKFVTEIEADLDVISHAGQGSTFTLDVSFDLPLVNMLANETAPHHEASRQLNIQLPLVSDSVEISTLTTIESPKPITKPASASTIPHLQICLIEDDDLACMAAQGILAQTSRPCDIHIARDVAEALVLLSKLPFDIIISDIGLPDGTGFDIAMAVKQDPSHVNYRTPFVALTAHSDDEKREKAKQAGFLAVYNKPLRVDDADKIFDDFVPKKDEVKPVSDVVDLAVSMKITGGNIDVICKMLHTLVDSFAIEKPLFFQAFYDNDFTQARQLFHKFRGGLSYVRVPTLEHRAKTLHEEVKALEQGKGTLSDLQPKLNELCDAVDAITAWLEKHKA